MSKLLEELRTLPAFNQFEAAIKQNLTEDNFYVQDQMPETGAYTEYDDDGHRCHCYTTHSQAVEEGIEHLLCDKDLFMEFLFEHLNDDVYELCKALVEEIRG